MPLRIAIDASRATVSRSTGTEYYSLRLIRSLIEANLARKTPHEIALYFRDAPEPDLFPRNAKTKQIVIPWPRAWTHMRFARLLWQTRPDITFVPAHTLPFLFSGDAVVTVHDLGYKHFPEAHPPGQRWYLDTTTRFNQKRAAIVLADSQATADDLRRFYGTSANKIRVLYPGVDAEPLKSDDDLRAVVRAKYNLPARYFIFLGTLQPRKNIKRLVKSFVQWQWQNGDHDTHLVLAGGKGWLFDERWLHDATHVKLLGYFDEADKGALLSQALALVYPSLYEGFGFPVIEAMLCGTPVIASKTSSLPELVGDAGILVDPLDISEISAAMTRIIEDGRLRETLIQRGKQRAALFTWEQSAQQLLNIFAEIKHKM